MMNGLDADIISATLTTVSTRSRRNTLARERALLRPDFQNFVRRIAANTFFAKLVRTNEEENLPPRVRERVAVARREMSNAPLPRRLEADLARP